MTDGARRMAMLTPTRRFTGGKLEVPVSGTNQAGALGDLGQQDPAQGGPIVEDDGRIRRFVTIFGDGVDARDLPSEEKTVKAGADQDLGPGTAGGTSR